MTQQRAHRLTFAILILSHLPICFSAETSDPTDPNRYLNAVRTFADNVLKYGRDTYGPKHTPLFVDGLNVNTHEPVKWISPKGDVLTATETEEWILSNFASQQTLLRTLDGLSEITGDPKYRDAAKQAIKYFFENLRAPNGLFYWGHATAYDAQTDKVKFGHPLHVLKVHYPYYELLWQVDQSATKKFIEAYWSAHVIDWSNLDFNRYALYSDSLEVPWNHEYKGGPVFFESKDSSANGFFHAGTSLVHAGTTLYRLSDQKQPLVWSKRLIQRFIDTRHPNTGISSYKYNQPQLRFVGGGITEHFDNPGTEVFPSLPFAVLRNMYHPEDVKMHQWLSVLLVGDMLGDQGREFTQWALEEITAWGKVSYREKDNAFVPILTDGTHIEGIMLEEDGPLGVKGSIAEPLFADAGYFWLYATAYKVTDDGFMWQMVRNIAKGNNFGDIGEASGQGPELKTDTTCSDAYSLLGFLELYNKTKKQEFLLLARRIADNIVANQFHKGFFVLSEKHIYARFDCFEPLALLHLVATVEAQSRSVPRVWPSSPLFVPPYRYKQEGEDRRIIYTLKSPEVSLSLQEAAHIGDINLVRTFLKNGTKPDSLDDGFILTALHRSAIAGHKDIAELLISHGARVDHGGCGSTPLHYAIQYGHREVVELLLAHGADINIKDNWGRGQTSLSIAQQAVAQGHEDLMTLLLMYGADVNAERDNMGRTLLHRAALKGQKELLQLLLSHGADVNAKERGGRTPLFLALRQGRKEVLLPLLTHGADVNAKAKGGSTPLSLAINSGDIEIIELFLQDKANVISVLSSVIRRGNNKLIEQIIGLGVDVNVRDKQGLTPLHYAVSSENPSKDITAFLIDNGAQVNIKDNEGMTPLMHAALKGYADMVVRLVDSGSNVNAKNKAGQTALDLAVEGNHREVIDLLREYKSKIPEVEPSSRGSQSTDKGFQCPDTATKHNDGNTTEDNIKTVNIEVKEPRI